MESWSVTALFESALQLVRDHIAYAEPIVFALGLGESLVIVSLFIPSTALFLAIGGIHSAAGGEFIPLWIAASIGAFIGDVISYALGRYFSDNPQVSWLLRANPRFYVTARHFTRHWGIWGIIFSKFLGTLRPFVPVVAGAMSMRWPGFIAASFVSCFLWAGTFLAPGYGFMWLMG